MNNQTLERLRQMHMFGMYDAFKTSLENTLKEQMTQDQLTSFSSFAPRPFKTSLMALGLAVGSSSPGQQRVGQPPVPLGTRN